MQQGLFTAAPDSGELLPLPDAHLQYFLGFYPPRSAPNSLTACCAIFRGSRTPIKMAGKPVKVPRLQSWHGDSNAHYGYSGLRLAPQPLTPQLQRIRNDLQQRLQLPFNSVLLNWYRDGNDSVAWHSDDEPELGRDPQIASLSFGVGRRFELRHRTQRELPTLRIELGDGSLLLMGNGVQRHYLHQIPKQRGITGSRLNLTFRFIHAVA